MKPKIGSLKKRNKTDKSLARLTPRKIQTKITKVRSKRGNIAIDLTETKRIIRAYYEQLYANVA